jgi:hypothetical protein
MKENEADVVFDLELDYLRGKYNVRDLWNRKDLGQTEGILKTTLPPHGAGLYRLQKLN